MDYKELKEHFEKRRPVQCINAIRYILSKLGGTKPAIYLEIGISRLATFEIFESILPDKASGGLAIGVNLYEKPFPKPHYPHGWKEFKSMRPLRGVVLIEGDSTLNKTIKEVELSLGGRKVDFLFIDGGHDYEVVRQDWYNYSKFVRPGGLVAFHDTGPGDGPRRVVNELVKEGYNIEDIPNTSLATTLVVNK